MAVFTEISLEQAQALATRLKLGKVKALQGIKAGIENSNFFLSTANGEFVLTVFERLSFEQLPFYLRLMQHLAQRHVAVPEPRADAAGEILFELSGKPAAVVERLSGSHQLAPDERHCAQVGAQLARMHLAGRDFAMHQPNLRGLAWWQQTVPVVLPHLDAMQSALIRSELAYQSHLATTAAYAALPSGPIHADLFRDNVMFDVGPSPASTRTAPRGGGDVLGSGPSDAPGQTLTGFFDFYFAGVDTWLFDIAVCLNDWCIDLDDGRLDTTRASAFVRAYESVRPLLPQEHRLLPALMRAAALRFWISRLWDFHLPREASMLKAHDPTHFERVLRQRLEAPWHAMTE